MITFQGDNVEVLRIFRTPKGRYIVLRPHEKDKKFKRIELKKFLLSIWIPFELKKPQEIVTHVKKKRKTDLDTKILEKNYIKKQKKKKKGISK